MFHVNVEIHPPTGRTTPHTGSTSPSVVDGSDRIHFFSGNPLVEIHHGVAHLYRKHGEEAEDSSWQRVVRRGRSGTADSGSERGSRLPLPGMRGTVIAVLAVPAYLSVADFLQFTACHIEHIKKMRIVRGQAVGRYMVLIQFQEQTHADDFFLEFNTKPYSTIEDDGCRCSLVFIDTSATEDVLIPQPQPPSSTELPTCPVCLERLDSATTGIMTILCNHTFHSECLSRWDDNTCPVCRHCQQPEAADSRCEVCGTSDQLWCCVVCGFLGCGRYNAGHGFEHFKESGHTFALELETQRVWDYAADGYVHRLVQNAVDGKVVEVPEPQDGTEGERDPDADEIAEALHEKINSVALEYQYLLTSQLDSQRAFFEAKLKDERASMAREMDGLCSERDALSTSLDDTRTRLQESERQRAGAERRRVSLVADLESVRSDLVFHQELVASLNKCQTEWREKVQKQDADHASATAAMTQRIATLEEDLRDMTLAVETATIVARNPELEGGDVVVGAGSSGGSGRGRRKGRGKRKGK